MRKLIHRLLSRITKNPGEQKNILHLGLNLLIYNADLPLYTGTELQAFQVRVGIQTGQMGSMNMVGQITSIITLLLTTGLVDRIRNRVRATAITYAGMVVFPLLTLILCLGPDSIRRPNTVYLSMMLLTVVSAAFGCLNNVVWATLFSRSISNSIRGRFMAIVGVVSGVIGTLIGLGSAYALKRYGYPHGFALAFGMAVILVLLSAIVLRGTKELPELQGEERSKLPPLQSMKQVVRLRQFRLLMPANILRSLGDGAGVFAMAVAMKRLSLSYEYAGYTTSLTYIAGLVATVLIGITVDRYGAGRVIPRVEVFLAAGLMGMVLVSSPIAFLGFFLLWQIALTMEGMSVPLVHFEVVPVEVIGAFSGLRFLILSVMAGVSSFTVGHLLEIAPPLLVYAFCAGIKLCAGALYWYGVKAVKRETATAVERQEAEAEA